MRNITLAVYQYQELSDDAKHEAWQNWWKDTNYPRQGANNATIEAFLKTFGVPEQYAYRNIIDRQIHKAVRGKRKSLIKRLIDDQSECPFTGYYLDCVITDTLKKYVNIHPLDMKAAVTEALLAVEKAIEADESHYYSQEHFEDICAGNSNNYEFFKNGERYYGD